MLRKHLSFHSVLLTTHYFYQGLIYFKDSFFDMDSFLIERKVNPTNQFVIGNDAVDADSIISAIVLAFVESMFSDPDVVDHPEPMGLTPIVSIPKESFFYERPEINLLLELSDVDNASEKLLFVEDLTNMLENDIHIKMWAHEITLVDHNTLNKPLQKFNDTLHVVEIVDHHKDEGQFTETCFGAHRIIAFQDDHALVASATTLVAERLKKLREQHLQDRDHSMKSFRLIYPSSIGTLLLGVILLDSVNLDPSVGKVTQRDEDAVSDLLSHTDWSNKVSQSRPYLVARNSTDHESDSLEVTVDTNAFFDLLQRAKYEPSFWKEMSVGRALLYDYKDFRYGLNLRVDCDVKDQRFGISTVLMPGLKFMQKERFVPEIVSFMKSEHISFLGIMFAFYDKKSGAFQRQLAFCADKSISLDQLVETFLASAIYRSVNLQLKEIRISNKIHRNPKLQISLFDQNNMEPSRKQIGPMLEHFFEDIALLAWGVHTTPL